VTVVAGHIIRSGIIGAGFIGGVHAHAVRAAGGRLTRVASHSPDAAVSSALRLGADQASATPQELIADPSVDVVHICTPNATHAPLARLALEQGKAVICEKPLATSVSDAEQLADLARAAGVVNAVPFVYRFHPLVREVRTRVMRGDAGRVWLIHGSYLQDWLSRRTDANWRTDPRLGGASRAFGDVGVHWCDLVEYVTGQRIVRLCAATANAFPDRVGTEDGAVMLFRTDAGASGSVVVSQVSPGRKNRLWFSVDGTDASFSFDQEQPETLWVGGRDENRLVLRDPSQLAAEAGRLARLPGGHQDAFSAFVADVYASVRGAQPEGVPTFEDGLRAALVTEAVLTSARTSAWVDVPRHHPVS
jgi:predicted dehydrogenase